jgi:hypothetical protein
MQFDHTWYLLQGFVNAPGCARIGYNKDVGFNGHVSVSLSLRIYTRLGTRVKRPAINKKVDKAIANALSILWP